jgi:hypothetical protein
VGAPGERVVELAGHPTSDEPDQRADGGDGDHQDQPGLVEGDPYGGGDNTGCHDRPELVGGGGGEQQDLRRDANQHLVLGTEVDQHGGGVAGSVRLCLDALRAGQQVVAQRIRPGPAEVAQPGSLMRTDIDL